MRFTLGTECLDTSSMVAIAGDGQVLFVAPDRRRVFVQTFHPDGDSDMRELDPWDVGPWADRTGDRLLQEIRVTIRS